MIDAPRVGLVFGGRSAEHQVSIRSARAVAAALADGGHEVVPLGIALDGCWTDAEASAAALEGRTDTLASVGAPPRSTLAPLVTGRFDVAFPLVHGTWGEDGTLQGLCEMLDLPYVGASVATSAVAMDKVLCKRQLEAVGVPTVDFSSFDRVEWEEAEDRCLEQAAALGETLFVKPAVGGSSVGITRVDDRGRLGVAIEDAFRFDDQVLVERAVEGRELECAVLGYRRLEASAIGEIVPGHDFYDYADKYLEDGAQLSMPARLDEAVSDRIRRQAVLAFQAIGGSGMARVDFLLQQSDGELYVNEINTLPGFTSISMYPKLWELSGVPIVELVARLVAIAIERHADRVRVHEAIDEWIGALESDPS